MHQMDKAKKIAQNLLSEIFGIAEEYCETINDAHEYFDSGIKDVLDKARKETEKLFEETECTQ